MFPLLIIFINIILIKAEKPKENNIFKDPSIFQHYYRYDEIIYMLLLLQKSYADKLTIDYIGKTKEGRDIPVVRISTNKFRNDKPIILIEAGSHSREWMSVAVAIYLINQLVEHKYMIRNVNWIIIPLLNPDGYEYSHTKNRLWRKNRSILKKCIGVDINRNFDFKWDKRESNIYKCSENSTGPRPFSEIESRALRDLTLKYQKNIKLYVTLHSYGQLIMYPWGYVNKSVSKKFENRHYNLGKIVANAISTIRNSTYIVGRISSQLYEVGGTSVDWMFEVAKIPLNYAIEINNYTYGFTAPEKEIIPNGNEIFKGFQVFHKFVQLTWIYKKHKKKRKHHNNH